MKRSIHYLLATLALFVALSASPAQAGGKGKFNVSSGGMNQSRSLSSNVMKLNVSPKSTMSSNVARFSSKPKLQVGSNMSSNLGKFSQNNVGNLLNTPVKVAPRKNGLPTGTVKISDAIHGGIRKHSPIINAGDLGVLGTGKGPIFDAGKGPIFNPDKPVINPPGGPIVVGPGKGPIFDPGKGPIFNPDSPIINPPGGPIVVGPGKGPIFDPGKGPIFDPDSPIINPPGGPIVDPGNGNPPADPGNPPADPGQGNPPADPGQPPADPGNPPADPGNPPADPCPPHCPPNNNCGGGWGFPIPFPTWCGGYYGGYNGGYCGTTTVVQPVYTQVTPAAVQPTVQAIDLELVEVRQLDRGDLAKGEGPAFRVTVRNKTGEAVPVPFTVALAASVGRVPAADSAFAASRVNGLQAGQSLSVDVRLPATAFKLGVNADGQPVAYTWLTAVVDSHMEVEQADRQNDLATMNRSEVVMVALQQ